MKRREATKKKALGNVPNLDRELVEGCLAALQELFPVEARKLATIKPGLAGMDERLELRLDGRKLRYFVEAKRVLRREQVGLLVHRAQELEEQDEQLLVCGTHIPDKTGEQLREHGVAYLDLGGNAHLRAPGLLVLATGRAKVVHNQRGRPNLTGTEARLLGVFLRDADAGDVVQQELATRAGIALGAVGRGREKLVQLGILDRTAKRTWRVRDRGEGLRRFAEGWASVIRHKLRPRGYRVLELKGKGDLEERLAKKVPKLDCLLGGELAAGLLTQFLETDHATLHVPPGRMATTAKALALVPDDQGVVTLLERYGRGDDYELRRERVPLAHPLLVWAECMTVPDERVAQAARRLREQLLERHE